MTIVPYLTDDILDSSTISHGFFTRHGGVSMGIYDSLNCGFGSKDHPESVERNRHLAASALGGAADTICGLFQIHSDICHYVDPKAKTRPKGDGLVTQRPDITLAILTADCVPILFADSDQGIIGAAHAGWRGAVRGIVASTIEKMVELGARVERIKAAIGPAIQQESYQVGPDLREDVLSTYPDAAPRFVDDIEDRWKFDLPGFVADRLSALGIAHSNIKADTYSDDRFFSHRETTHLNRTETGRLVSMIRLKGE